jgi:hypothetical protein
MGVGLVTTVGQRDNEPLPAYGGRMFLAGEYTFIACLRIYGRSVGKRMPSSSTDLKILKRIYVK